MITKKELKKNLTPKINFHKPKELEQLAKLFKGKFKNIDLESFQIKLEFPLKPIEEVYQLLLEKNFDKLYFLDITRVLYDLKLDINRNYDKKKIFISLQEFLSFVSEKSSLRIFIFKVSAKILKKPNHSLNEAVKNNIENEELKLIKLCSEKQFSEIYSYVHSKSLSRKLASFGVKYILKNEINEYPNFLIKNLVHHSTQLNSRLKKHYENNLLEEGINSKKLNQQIRAIIEHIEDKKNIIHNSFLEQILVEKLGEITDSNSNWYQLNIDDGLIRTYKKLKGVLEFARFVKIAEYLTESDEIFFDENKIKQLLMNRTLFWSHYDEVLSSVKIWVNDEDYKLLERDKPVHLDDIEILEDMHNEVCLLEFKKQGIIIIEFFRNKDKNHSNNYFHSLIFMSSNKFKDVNNLLENNNFNFDLYKNKLKPLADYEIQHKDRWQYWVERFLTEENISPNKSIIENNKFQITQKFSKDYNIQTGIKQDQKVKIEKEKILVQL